MNNVIILRYGELHLKGKNRGIFEKMLFNDIKCKLSDIKYKLLKISGRLIVSEYEVCDETKIIDKLCFVFGLVSLSTAVELITNYDDILSYCEGLKIEQSNFRATVNRADKKFEKNSNEFSAIVGGAVLKNNAHLKVNLQNPQCEIMVDIRENGKTYISFNKIKCAGGMPFGSAGKGLIMLSGGIDSPVCAYQVAKRGLSFDALHFHSFPHTSLAAKEKVVTLAKKLKKFSTPFNLFMCSFTKIQEAIFKHCDEEYMITIMRRIMLRIAEKICLEKKYSCVVTGESLGQVASQTIESITCTNAVMQFVPVLRPLISFDKNEIIEVSKKIDTYETSILPFEDCCTIFLPEKPIIKPIVKKCVREEGFLEMDKLIEEAISTLEIIKI